MRGTTAYVHERLEKYFSNEPFGTQLLLQPAAMKYNPIVAVVLVVESGGSKHEQRKDFIRRFKHLNPHILRTSVSGLVARQPRVF